MILRDEVDDYFGRLSNKCFLYDLPHDALPWARFCKYGEICPDPKSYVGCGA